MAQRVSLIFRENPGSLPADYTFAPIEDVELASVVARVDGAGAAATFVPTLEVLAQSGSLIARVRSDQEFLVGDTGVVTFAPFLRRNLLARVGKPLCQVTLGLAPDPPQSIANDTSTLVSWGVQVFDTANMFTLAAPTVITITESGFYHFSGSLEFSASITGYRRVELRRNDTTNSGLDIRGANPTALITTACMMTSAGAYTAGETMVVRVRQNAGGPLNLSGGLTVYKIAEAL